MSKKKRRSYTVMDPGRKVSLLARFANAFPIQQETVKELMNSVSVNVEVSRGQHASYSTWGNLMHGLVLTLLVVKERFDQDAAAQVRAVVTQMDELYKRNAQRLPVDRSWKSYPELVEGIYMCRDIIPEMTKRITQVDLSKHSEEAARIVREYYPELED